MENSRGLLSTGTNMYSVGIWFTVPIKIACFCDRESREIGTFKIFRACFLKSCKMFQNQSKYIEKTNKPGKVSNGRRRNGSWWVKTSVQNLKHQGFFTYHINTRSWGLRNGWVLTPRLCKETKAICSKNNHWIIPSQEPAFLWKA